MKFPIQLLLKLSLLLALFLGLSSQARAKLADRMACAYAPRIILHPNEQYAISNVRNFLKNFWVVLKKHVGAKKIYFRATPENLDRLSTSGWVRLYRSDDPKWRKKWWMEANHKCQYKSKSRRCDRVYLRSRRGRPIADYIDKVRPEVYYYPKVRHHNGRAYTVIQYFYLLHLNDAQNKHDGEWESFAVVVDNQRFKALESLGGTAQRYALSKLITAGHYKSHVYGPEVIIKEAKRIFVTDTAHPKTYMSLGGHGGYLLPSKTGLHVASLKCFEYVSGSQKWYDAWHDGQVKLVPIRNSTPWVRYVGRWGRRYTTLFLPMKFSFSLKKVGYCKGRFGTGWLKSRVTVINSAPYGPRLIHGPLWNWGNFPEPPGPTPKKWR